VTHPEARAIAPAQSRGVSIPLSRPDLGPEETAAVADVMAGGLLAQGLRVAELESRWAEYCGVKHAVALSSGTVALMSIFAGLGLGPGDEVITVSHSFPAAVSAILFTGATPVFVDIEPDTFLMNAGRIEAAITSRTRAICPVSLFGMVADMDAIGAIADRHGLTVVEDACQAHGALYRGRRAGSFGYGAFKTTRWVPTRPAVFIRRCGPSTWSATRSTATSS